MLPPYYFDTAASDLVELYSQLDQAIIRDIVRRLVKTGGITETAKWQAERLQEGGLLMNDIIQSVASMSNASAAQIKAMFEDAGIESVQYDSWIYEAAGLTPLPLKQSPSAMQILQANIRKTSGYIQNLTMTTASTGQQAFIQGVTMAEMQIESGAFNYITAIRKAVSDAVQSGSTVLYPTGHHDYLDVAVRRAALTGISQTAANISLGYADDMGCDLVETTAHPGARPEHQIWQGKIFSRSGKKSKYPDFVSSTGYGTGDGLCGWNCRHSFFPYFEGISSGAYPRDKIQEYNSRTVTYNDDKINYYDATQLQRSFERQIRATKRKLAGYDEGIKSTDDEQLRNALKEKFDGSSVNLKQQESELKDFLHQTGLVRQREREQTLGFSRSQSQKAVHADNRSYIENLKSKGINISEKDIANHKKLRYTNPPEYELQQKYLRSVDEGMLSPMSGYDNYKALYTRVESEIVGSSTSNGVQITAQSEHFMERIVGTMSDPLHEGRPRAGVSIDDIKDALQNGKVYPIKMTKDRKTGKMSPSQLFSGKSCDVSVNPSTGVLIQCNLA